MARTRRRATRPGLALDLTPMVDVVFLLIIFFMVSTTFITLESGLPVDLPDARTAQSQADDLPTVTVDRDGQVYVAGTPVSEAQLVAVLQPLVDASPAGVVVLRADAQVPHGQTVRIMDLMRQAGASRIAIATGG